MLLAEQDPEVRRAGDGREGCGVLYAGHRVAAQWWVLLRVARAAAAKRLSSELLLSYRAAASVRSRVALRSACSSPRFCRGITR